MSLSPLQWRASWDPVTCVLLYQIPADIMDSSVAASALLAGWYAGGGGRNSRSDGAGSVPHSSRPKSLLAACPLITASALGWRPCLSVRLRDVRLLALPAVVLVGLWIDDIRPIRLVSCTLVDLPQRFALKLCRLGSPSALHASIPEAVRWKAV